MSWETLPITPQELSEGQCKSFDLGDQNYFIVKKHGQLHAYRNLCPHQSINLEWKKDVFLDVEKSLIQCASHGALFTIQEGRCVAGPCVGKNLQELPLRTHLDQLQGRRSDQ